METLKSELGMRMAFGIRRVVGEKPNLICGEKTYKVGIETGESQGGGVAPGTGVGT